MAELTPAEAREIAKEAFIYAYSIVHGYRALHWLGVRKGGFNKLEHYRHIIEPTDDLNKEVQINLDTLYTLVPFDTRREPLVFTVPAFPDRYFSVQFSDLYMHNYAWLGTRTSGQGGGTYLLAGPHWQGETPPGIDAVIPCETDISYFVIRILCRGKVDEPAVNAIQDRFKLQPLSEFLGTEAPPPAPDPEWKWPSKTMFKSVDIYDYFAFLLKFFELREDEQPLFDRFARIGIVPGQPFDPDAFGPEIRKVLEQTAAETFQQLMVDARAPGTLKNGWFVVPRIRGDRNLLSGSPEAYYKRAVQAAFGIYGVDLEECVYFPSEHDENGDKVDPSKGDYVVTLPAQMPVEGFWSITVYEAKNQFLVPNELGRYALGDRSNLIVDEDGKVRIHLQHRPPVPERMANWLPCPEEPLLVVLRMYIPAQDVIEAKWIPEPIRKVR
ncbi:DUF1254 domain-containing protein [Novosphingobium malaysiense]|uniref:Cell envelope protein n=1 Tax=Novosphingobium malaysiense TaxID=1348853 RepID=A0A0B1ZDS0_9SPHN|nr:DUF1254 domain-containing protein [Novosphingobium malaysiense]KHK89184.1 hypothetical protein LK12_21940 [Novosphingobium malaysiense]